MMDAETLKEKLTEVWEDRRKTWDRNGQLYASDLGKWGCPLAFWRQLQNYPQKPPSAGVMLMFNQGNNLEEQVATDLAEALEHTGEWEIVDQQTSVEFGGITGKLDVLLRNWYTGELLVLEVKTKRGRAFRYLPEADPSNVLQCQFYMAGTGATKGIVIYVDREGQNFVKAFDVEPDAQAVLDGIAELKSLRDGDAPPPMRPTLTRRKNKGPDSLVLDVPKQLDYCNDKDCQCKNAIRAEFGKLPAGKIVAKQSDDGSLKAEKGYEEWLPLVEALLQEQNV